MKAKNRILLHRIGYTLAGLACITFALDWRAGLAAFGAMLILRRLLITLGAQLGGFALAHFRPASVLPPEDVGALGAGIQEVPIGFAEAPPKRERVERPGKMERPPARPPLGDSPAAPPQPPEEKKRHGAVAEDVDSMEEADYWPGATAGEEKSGQLEDLVSVRIEVPVSSAIITLREDLEPLREEIASFPPAPPDADFPLDGPPKA